MTCEDPAPVATEIREKKKGPNSC